MADEVRQLGEAQRDRTWQSTFTGALYRWNEGWEVGAHTAGEFAWNPVRPGVVTSTVYAHASERFVAQ